MIEIQENEDDGWNYTYLPGQFDGIWSSGNGQNIERRARGSRFFGSKDNWIAWNTPTNFINGVDSCKESAVRSKIFYRCIRTETEGFRKSFVADRIIQLDDVLDDVTIPIERFDPGNVGRSSCHVLNLQVDWFLGTFCTFSKRKKVFVSE